MIEESIVPGRIPPVLNFAATAELDARIANRRPDFDGPKVRTQFRRVIPNLRTVVVHCFDPRVTGIPAAVAAALPGQEYPGEVFQFVDEVGNPGVGSTTSIFSVVNAGGRAAGSAERSISVACHLFDIDNVAVVHHTDCGGTHFTPEGIATSFAEEFGLDIATLYEADDICHESFALSLHRDLRALRTSRGTPRHVNLYGYVYEIGTGQLHLIEESPGDPRAPRGAAWR